MKVEVSSRDARELLPLHQLYCDEADCQLVYHSFWFRGLLDAYAIEVDGVAAGYAAVSNHYGKGRLAELYVRPEFRESTREIAAVAMPATGATHIAAQSNVPLMLSLLQQFAEEPTVEKMLFADRRHTQLAARADTIIRPRREVGELPIFRHEVDPVGEWVLETAGEIVATGGYLTHYNPPFASIYLEVARSHWRRGYGSYLAQEIKRICGELGKRPVARCDPANIASHRTLEKAGLALCGELLVGRCR